MMEISVTTLDGKSAGKASLDAAVFGIDEIRSDILQRTVRWQLAKRQAGTHKTQTRSEVSRTTKKYIRQKGSGGARHGARNAPIFVGGSVAHGPRVRSHAHGLPKRVRRLALAHALSSKLKADAVIVLDAAELDAPRTKALSVKLAGLGIDNALIIGGISLDENFVRAARNIPNVDVLPVAGLNVYDILRRDKFVVTKGALEGISARLEGRLEAVSPFSGDAFVDDIQLVDGIGPKAARELRGAGMGTLTQFAAASDADRAAALETLGMVERAAREQWLEQAREMIEGKPPRARVDRDYAARQLAKRRKEGR